MPVFRVDLCGRHLQLTVDGRNQECGFQTTRVVDATSAEHAASLALELIMQHPAVAAQEGNSTTSRFAVLVESVAQLHEHEPVPPQQAGLVFFPEDGEEPLV